MSFKLAMFINLASVCVIGASQLTSHDSTNTYDEGEKLYAIIVHRNAFQLAGPPPAVTSTAEIAVPAVKLTGLIKMANQRPRALFVNLTNGTNASYSLR